MKITNESGLPLPLVRAVSAPRRPALDTISVTTLIGPPQIRLLTMRHWDDLEEDASARIWATMGGLMHQLLESYADGMSGHRAERRLETVVEGFTVTGQYDLLHETDGALTDYKFVSVYTTMDGVKAEWVEQLNLYAELIRRSGGVVTRLSLVAIYRDWSKNKAFGHGYPNSQVQVFDVPLWTAENASEFIAGRVRLHAAAQAGARVECTAAERWARPTRFALMKEGNKKALKLYDDEREAREAVTKAGLYVEERPGGNARCEGYCAVAEFCVQFARLRGDELAARALEGGWTPPRPAEDGFWFHPDHGPVHADDLAGILGLEGEER